ncbi:MAG TPA: glutamate--tRNA ligase, partial [Burkholderiales bacterium]
QQFVEWFDLEHISRSAAQFNPEKLLWLNQQYMKAADPQRLAKEIAPRLHGTGVEVANGPALHEVVAMFQERATTLRELAEQASLIYRAVVPSAEVVAQHVSDEVRPALRELLQAFEAIVDWNVDSVTAAFSGVLKAHGLKMPKLAIPLRVVVYGTPHTPSLYPLLALSGKARVVSALGSFLF